MLYLLMGLLVGLIVGLDQLVKGYVVASIPLGGTQPFLPGLIRLTYSRNTGAAFSLLQCQPMLFMGLFVVLTLLLVLNLRKEWLPFTKPELWCIAAVYGGGLGNMIDRVRLGYVVDMFETEFMNFPVFNVADSFITCGAILLCIHLVFFNKEFWKSEEKK